MPITTLAKLESASKQKFQIVKSNISGQVIGGSTSFWGFGTSPVGVYSTSTTAAVLDNTTPGAIPFVNPPGGLKTHISSMSITSGGAGGGEIHDRLMHTGISGAVTTAQSLTGFDLSTQSAVSNLSERKGRSDYSSVQWWIEATTGSTSGASSATILFTDHSGTGPQSTTVTIPSGAGVGCMFPILTSNPGQYIRGITQITLSAVVGTNLNIVATLQRTELFYNTSPFFQQLDWAMLGLPVIYDSSCLCYVGINSGTISRGPNINLTLVQG